MEQCNTWWREVNNSPTASGAACMFYDVVVGVKQRLALILADTLYSVCFESFILMCTTEDMFLSLIWFIGISSYASYTH